MSEAYSKISADFQITALTQANLKKKAFCSCIVVKLPC
ncbi:hypothetical protein NBRC3188_1165 [Acetobacter pasteurianus NBRC 3188]|uniref:Uncharacterized protein n=1 Tax=Acetobacter pasteurianus NBRC 3188 TaxID=1226663 RepID=A0A401WSZ9_ACEPA|nr:hypothetical protein NBRC3188_1165 [Acetobacter pasteurianus NBRC 3188]